MRWCWSISSCSTPDISSPASSPSVRSVATSGGLRSLDIEDLLGSTGMPPITLIAPAYNEEATCVEAIRSLLTLRYGDMEILVCNDGSKDKTLERLMEAFDLEKSYRLPDRRHPHRGNPGRLSQHDAPRPVGHRQAQRRQGRHAECRPQFLPHTALLRDGRRQSAGAGGAHPHRASLRGGRPHHRRRRRHPDHQRVHRRRRCGGRRQASPTSCYPASRCWNTCGPFSPGEWAGTSSIRR